MCRVGFGAGNKVMKLNWLADKYSVSKCKTFSMCPRKFFYRYVMRRKEAASFALLYGRGVHMGQEVDNIAKIHGEQLKIEEVLDAAVTGLEEEAGKEDIKVDIDAFAEEHKTQLDIYEKSGLRAEVVPIPG